MNVNSIKCNKLSLFWSVGHSAVYTHNIKHNAKQQNGNTHLVNDHQFLMMRPHHRNRRVVRMPRKWKICFGLKPVDPLGQWPDIFVFKTILFLPDNFDIWMFEHHLLAVQAVDSQDSSKLLIKQNAHAHPGLLKRIQGRHFFSVFSAGIVKTENIVLFFCFIQSTARNLTNRSTLEEICNNPSFLATASLWMRSVK